jgi:hypothetical protein
MERGDMYGLFGFFVWKKSNTYDCIYSSGSSEAGD